MIVDPTAGFVTGGGWIESPPNAMGDNFSFSGAETATFGFVSKYKKGQSTPTGETRFVFTAGGLIFDSTSLEWLVITGSDCAKYKGLGTVNGNAGFGFMLTACDVAEPGSGADTFRIKLWDTSNNDALVYDNQVGESDDSYTGTVIGGGNIQIKQPKNGGKGTKRWLRAI